jgi:hypothetical protein
MRTWGRQYFEDGTYKWVEVTTDANGYTDNVYITTLAQCLKLNLGESPFYGNYGIPQYQTIMTQVMPDFYASQTQTQFAPYFASLSITRVQAAFPPVYQVNAVCHSGAILTPEIFMTNGLSGGQLDSTFILDQSTLS